MIPIIVVALVFVLIIIRRIGKFRFQIWQIMLLGAIAVLATLQISPLKALKAVNLDVMFFLFGMFIIGEALVEGAISHTFPTGFFAGRNRWTVWCSLSYSVWVLQPLF